MRQVVLPSSKEGSHAGVLELVHKALGLGLQPRILIVLLREAEDKEWRSAFGRIDLARTEDPAPVLVRPSGNVRLVEDRPSPEAFVERLKSAFRGGGFTAGDVTVADHAMDSPWTAQQLTSEWGDYGTGWPSICAAPSSEVKRRLYPGEAIEAAGPVPVFRDLGALLRAVAGFRVEGTIAGDIRFNRFQVLIWDYRGRFDRFKIAGPRLDLAVSPSGDSALRVVGVVEGASETRTVAEAGPTALEVDIGEPILSATMSLRRSDSIVEERSFELPTLLGASAVDNAALPAGVAPARSLRHILDLGFMTNAGLRTVVERDVSELELAVVNRMNKAALLLAGSILEALLLDVLGRNRGIAASYLRPRAVWPDDASLGELIRIAGQVEPVPPNGPSAPLLGAAACAAAGSVTDHRDLIHPCAELRDQTKVDVHTVDLMVALLRNAARDLNDAAAGGLLDAYARGDVK